MPREIDYTKGLGLNLDDLENNRSDKGSVSFALNAVVTSTKNEGEYAYQTEEGTTKYLSFKDGEKPIGVFYIGFLQKTIYFLDSNKIGLEDNGTYTTLVQGECLGFDENYPIHQIAVKTTNKTVQVYWTDDLNTMRFIDLDDLPFKTIPNPDNDYQTIKLEGELDCNKIKVMPNFSMPIISNVEVVEGGSAKEGVVQFGVAYSNDKGNLITSVYNVSNPIHINERTRATQDYDSETSKSVKFNVENLDNTGIFKYFTVIVVETINNISTPKILGTYPVTEKDYEIIYSGEASTNITIPEEELFRKFPYYKYAQGVTTSDGNIIWYGLRENRKVNYQQIWSKVKTNWVSYQLPYNNENEGYGDPSNVMNHKSFMRDETYPLEGVLLLKNGRETEAFHIPSREQNPNDLVQVENEDVMPEDSDRCNEAEITLPKWKVYNTAYVTETDANYSEDGCYKGVYQRGEFSYVESTELYPANPDIWGDLAGKPIRHHKFPDEAISPRFKTIGENTFIYPIGVEIDRDSLLQAIEDSDLTQDEKDDIVGFKILRGDRSQGNMSIMAKGNLYNVGKYKNEEGEDRYFPNYPYNSLSSDPLFAKEKLKPLKGFQITKASQPYKDDQGKDQFTFHSPDTHFGRVASVDSGVLKIEAIDYGEGYGEIVDIKDNAEYKFLTQNTQKYALVLATTMALEYKGKKARPSFNGTDFAQVYNNMTELFDKLVPYNNFGRNINSVANFNKSIPVKNDGFKQRRIEFGRYLADGFNAIEDGKTLNNTRRESSVYLKTNKPLKYPTEYSPQVPSDLSRFIKSTHGIKEDISMEEFYEMGKPIYQEFDGVVKEGLNVEFLQSLLVGATQAGEEIADNANDSQYISAMVAQIAMQIVKDYDYNDLHIFENQVEACWNEDFPTFTLELETHLQPLKTYVLFSIDGETIYGTESDLEFEEVITNYTPQYVTNNQNIYYLSAIDEMELEAYQEEYLDYLLGLSLLPNAMSSKLFLAYNYYLVRGINIFSGIDLWYLNQPRTICGGALLTASYKAIHYAKDVFVQYFQNRTEEHEHYRTNFKVNNYYASIKRNKPNQWGRIYSYPTVDTGTVNFLKDKEFKPIFGGDTFINRFSIKRKQQIFTKSTVNEHDGTDIALDEEGSLGNPMFWISTKPLDMGLRIDEQALQASFSGIGATIKNIVVSNVMNVVGDVLVSAGLIVTSIGVGAFVFPPAGVVVTVVGLVITAVGALLKLISSIFRNKTTEIEKATIKILRDLVVQIAEKLGIKNVNLDNLKGVENSIRILGDVYQYVYGIPTNIVESQVNVSERKALNDDESNFYPRITGGGEGIPHDWLQESRVPIAHDNYYGYNKTFSKQNREAIYGHLREDFEKDKDYTQKYLNRAIYGDKEEMREDINGWRIYKPMNFYDFPKEYGSITSIDGIGSKQVLVRFKENSQIYNAQSQLNVQGIGVYLGDPTMFTKAPPLDLGEGSQHRMLISTPFGYVYVNSEKGRVVLVGGRRPELLSDLKVRRWFQKHLPFKTKEDNHYKGVTGLHGVFDPVHNRILITKIEEGRSWTISFSFISKRWIGWHSYIPNYYVEENTKIRLGKNGEEEEQKIAGTFRTFFGKIYPYIIEFPFTAKQPKQEIIQSIEDFSTVERFDEDGEFWEVDDMTYFNKALVYNKQQSSGLLKLTPKDPNDLSQYFNYPMQGNGFSEILVDKRDEGYRFNQFYDRVTKRNTKIIKNQDKPVAEEIEFEDVLDYGEDTMERTNIRGRNSKVRLIHDTDESDVRITTDIITNVNQKSES